MTKSKVYVIPVTKQREVVLKKYKKKTNYNDSSKPLGNLQIICNIHLIYYGLGVGDILDLNNIFIDLCEVIVNLKC